MESETTTAARRRLSLFDAASIIVGIIIGSSIYKLAPMIAANVASPTQLILAWVCGGVFALAGALCYAELACALPQDGGEYIYLGRAYGRGAAFLYAWAVLWVIRPGTIGSIAFVFAEHAQKLLPIAQVPGQPPSALGISIYAVGIVLLLTGINMLGIRPGARTQNVLSVTKTVGLLAIIAAAFVKPAADVVVAPVGPITETNFGLAMIFILYAYGGWSDMPMAAAEVRDPERNLIRALLLGTLLVTAIYLLMSVACLYSVGFDRLRSMSGSQLIAVELVRPMLGQTGERLISALVCVTAAGALNGMVFTGARVSYALGQDYSWLAPLARWSDRYGGPLVALAAQAAVTLVLIRFFGQEGSGFERMVQYTSPVFYTFFLLTGAALVVLRLREPDLPRPFRTPGLPVTGAIFCGSSLFMLYSSVNYAIIKFREGETHEAFWAGGIMLVGVAVCAVSMLAGKRRRDN